LSQVHPKLLNLIIDIIKTKNILSTVNRLPHEVFISDNYWLLIFDYDVNFEVQFDTFRVLAVKLIVMFPGFSSCQL